MDGYEPLIIFLRDMRLPPRMTLRVRAVLTKGIGKQSRASIAQRSNQVRNSIADEIFDTEREAILTSDRLEILLLTIASDHF